MELNTLTAISPIDGRYRDQVQHLGDYFSEYALIRYRVLVEVEYFLFLSGKKLFPLPAVMRKQLQSVVADFGHADAQWIKDKEKETNHDVKAVEYFLKAKLEERMGATGTTVKANSGARKTAAAKAQSNNGAGDIREWIHFGLTSQDINNTAIPLAWKHALEFEYLPGLLNSPLVTVVDVVRYIQASPRRVAVARRQIA